MKIAIDIGNRNIKICFKKGGKLIFDIFQSRFLMEVLADYTDLEVVEYEDVKYCIEQGNYDFEFNKADKNYLPLLLAAIARCSDAEKLKIELMISCPAQHVLGLREVFKSQLEGKVFNFKYRNSDREVTIEKLGVIGEGFATFFAIPKAIRGEIKNLGILDIGGRTSNIATFINGKQDKLVTINRGIIDVKNEILSDFKEKGKDYDIVAVENLIDRGKVEISDTQKENLIKAIINDAKLEKIYVDFFDWFVTGGGAIDIGESTLSKFFGEDCLLDNALYSNVNGNYYFLIAKWGED